MVQRDGMVHAIRVPDTKSATLLPIIRQFCAENSHFFTDELNSYSCLEKESMLHSVIEHGKREFSKNGITTDSIEGFWGHFKRMVFGTYHFVSRDRCVSYRISPYKQFGNPQGYRLYVYKAPLSKSQWGFAHQRFDDGNIIVRGMINMKLIRESDGIDKAYH